MNALDILLSGDAVHISVALVLLAMSVASWGVIVWKAWFLRRANADLARCTAAFWQAPSLAQALPNVRAFDRNAVLTPLVQAAQSAPEGPLAQDASKSQQLTRLLRNALHGVLERIQSGQVVLATVGATAPCVGLLGTVWGIYHALIGIDSAGTSIEKLAGPVGEALVMTAAGLAVAIPAVLAYNIFGRSIARIEADLEGFALDLRDLLS
jgi:biopolymer transport protein ExbB